MCTVESRIQEILEFSACHHICLALVLRLTTTRYVLTSLSLPGVMSPVHNDYKKHKKSLIDYSHRRAMVELATHNTWIKCSTWEGKQNTWTPTRQVGKTEHVDTHQTGRETEHVDTHQTGRENRTRGHPPDR